jgi:cytochrome c biogenesis protein CcmG/thiol:disulfide interchange protein DsbE
MRTSDQLIVSGMSLDGRPVSLNQLQGRAILLNFWATWCGACQEEFPFLEELYSRFRGNGLVVIGVNVDDSTNMGQVTRFVSDFEITFPVWLAPAAMEAPTLESVIGLPTTVIIDRSGRETWRHSGILDRHSQGVIEAIYSALRLN